MGPGSGFVGRAAEMALLTGLIRAAGRGEGGVALIGGEPGIGKTRLADEAAARAAAGGMARVRARALPDEGCPPYWLFRQVIGEVVKTFIPNEFQHAHLSFIAPGPGARPPRLDLAEQRFAIFESVREYLTAAAASQGLTQQEVARQLAVVTGRTVAPELAAAIGRRSHGNPFFVGELARMIDAGPSVLPDAVRDTVRVRLHDLSSACRDVLVAAAVLGTAVDPAAVAAVAGREPAAVLAALDEAAAAGIRGRELRPRPHPRGGAARAGDRGPARRARADG